MAVFWATKSSIPFASEEEKKTPEYSSLLELQGAIQGLTVAQGAPDVFGCFEMICALHFHYLNFMRVIQRKISMEIPYDSPDERFEAVAYIGRVGQLAYFSKSKFVCELMGDNYYELIAWIHRLIPFRHKYSAHRERDKPIRKGEATSLEGEVALGALGGKTFAEKYDGAFLNMDSADLSDWAAREARRYEFGYVVFQITGVNAQASLTVEHDHQYIFSELLMFFRGLVDKAKTLPRG